MNSVDVKSSTDVDFNVENNETNPKFEVGDHVRTWKYKNLFCETLCSKLVWRSFKD